MGLPVCSFEIRTARAWRRGVLTLSALGMLATAVWVATLFSRGEGARAIWGVPAIIACLLAATSARGRRGRLRRDAQRWHWCESFPREVSETPGSLTLMLDGGGWMLLRFRSAGAGRWRPAGTWLALASRDFPGDWHAWRCAVYSPRSDPAGLAAQAPADPPA